MMDATKILKDMIVFDTSAPPGLNYEAVMDYLEPLFRSVGFTTGKVAIPAEHADGNGPRVNLLAHRRQTGRPRLVFYAHVDVVPARGWAAFEPRVADGKVYGRGAADMKGAIAALLSGLEAVAGRKLKYDTSVMITTDEETGQPQQLRYLKPYLEPVAGAHFFNLDASFGYVGVADLGDLQLDIRVQGRSVHSAMSHRGENAVEKATLLLDALLKLKPRVEKRKSKVALHPGTGLERMQGRLNINMVKGGIKVNVVPDECIISVDRRLIPEENIDTARKELLDTLAAVPGVDWEVVKEFAIPTVPPCESPLVDELAALIGEVAGGGGKFGEMGSGDLPHIVAGWGGLTFNLGVIRAESNIHGREEFAYQQDIEDLAKIIARFIAA